MTNANQTHLRLDEELIDTDYSHASSNYVTAPPSGVLSVHVKEVKMEENQFPAPEIEVYVRFRVGSVSKKTTIVTARKGKQIVINDLKNFSLTISRHRTHPSNEVRMDLIMVISSNIHRILAHKEMHVYDIIKNLYVAGTYDLKFRQQHVAYLEVEMCFAYGIFGFGVSHQLENRQKNSAEIVSHSLLCRSHPPENRRQSDSLVMTAIPVDHPSFINFDEKVEIGTAGRDFSPSVTQLDPFGELKQVKPVVVLKAMKSRVDRMHSDYNKLKDRAQRKNFLEKLVLKKTEDIQGSEVSHGLANQPGPSETGTHEPNVSNLPTMDYVTVNQEEEYEEGGIDVKDMSKMLQVAPGIVTRGHPRKHRMMGLTPLPELSFESSFRDLESDPSTEPAILRENSVIPTQSRRRSTMADVSMIFRRLTTRLRGSTEGEESDPHQSHDILEQ